MKNTRILTLLFLTILLFGCAKSGKVTVRHPDHNSGSIIKGIFHDDIFTYSIKPPNKWKLFTDDDFVHVVLPDNDYTYLVGFKSGESIFFIADIYLRNTSFQKLLNTYTHDQAKETASLKRFANTARPYFKNNLTFASVDGKTNCFNMVGALGQTDNGRKFQSFNGAFLKNNGNKHVIVITAFIDSETKFSELDETLKSLCGN